MRVTGRGLTSGYSGTPLAKKLGIRSGRRAWADGMPDSVKRALLVAEPRLAFLGHPEPPLDFVHLFVRSRADLAGNLVRIRPLLAQDGMVWVSWPKKTSRIETDVTENVVRDHALPLGLVDIKVCAVDNI